MGMRVSINGKTVMVTGGAGFIGSHLVDSLLRDGAAKVIVIDNLFTGDEKNLSGAFETGRLQFYRDDAELFTSLSYIFENHTIDIVFNCATKALNYSFLNPSNAFSTNTSITLNLLEHLRLGQFKTLAHFSTSEVYGTAMYEPMDEIHPKNPTTTYAAGKAAADMAVESYVKMFGVDAFIIRPFNNYGPRQNYKGILAGVIPITALKILQGIPPEIHGNGLKSRDFVFVNDTVEAVLQLYRILPAGETVNIATDNQVSIADLIEKISSILDYSGDVVYKAPRNADVLCHNADTVKLHSLIDFSVTPFDVGLKATMEFYQKAALEVQK